MNAWECELAPATGQQRDSVEVVVDMLDPLWTNQMDRHRGSQTSVPITQRQAEVAVNVALPLVPIFRNGALMKR